MQAPFNILSKYLFIAIATVTVFTACNNAQKQDKNAADSISSAITEKPARVDSGTLVGAWHDEAIKTDKGEEIAYEVVSKGHKVYIQPITFTGKNLTLNDTPPISPSASEIKKDGDKYVGVHNPEEVYKIDHQGNLLIYDKDVLVATCKRIL